MARAKATYYLRCWSFTPPDGGPSVKIQAAFDMTEEQARERLGAKGRDVTGWAAKLDETPVRLEEVPEGGTGKWAVTIKAKAYASHTFEVEAETEEEAEALALSEAESYPFDYEGDDDFEVDEVEEVEEVAGA